MLVQDQEELAQFEIAVDAEHGGIRFVGCSTFLLMLIMSFFGLAILMSNEPIIAGISSLAIASGVAYTAERFFKARWPSGRKLVATAEHIHLLTKGKVERSVNPQQHVNVLSWYFVVKRAARVKKGWYVIGLSLEQDDEYVPVYTFASPDDFAEIPFSDSFQRLEKSKQKKKESASVHSMRVAGEQRRLLIAEQDRGYFGAEVTLEEFKSYLLFLNKTFPDWMIHS